MPALNFQLRWAPDVESGKKHTTIRKARRVQVRDNLYLYTGQRTKQCRKLGEALCLGVTDFRINNSGFCYLDGKLLLEPDINYLAWLDTAGQLNATEFVDFFRQAYGLPFYGELIIW